MTEYSNRNRFPTLAQVRELPVQLEHVIPPDWQDRNGHVNVQYYLALFELGGWKVLEEIGMDEAWFQRHQFSFFDLEHHLHYLSELHVGDVVTTYNRIIGKSDKRFHGLYLIVDETRERLACTLEYISNGVDMQARRTAPMPAALALSLERLCEQHRQLSWEAPLCGRMAP